MDLNGSFLILGVIKKASNYNQVINHNHGLVFDQLWKQIVHVLLIISLYCEFVIFISPPPPSS